jgi:hypothetical protein
MTTAIIIVLIVAVVTLWCVNRVLRDDLQAMEELARSHESRCDELKGLLRESRKECSGWAKLEELRVADRKTVFQQHEDELARASAELIAERAKSIELARQVKQRVQPMILIMRPMLDALEAMELPEFTDAELHADAGSVRHGEEQTE